MTLSRGQRDTIAKGFYLFIVVAVGIATVITLRTCS